MTKSYQAVHIVLYKHCACIAGEMLVMLQRVSYWWCAGRTCGSWSYYTIIRDHVTCILCARLGSTRQCKGLPTRHSKGMVLGAIRHLQVQKLCVARRRKVTSTRCFKGSHRVQLQDAVTGCSCRMQLQSSVTKGSYRGQLQCAVTECILAPGGCNLRSLDALRSAGPAQYVPCNCCGGAAVFDACALPGHAGLPDHLTQRHLHQLHEAQPCLPGLLSPPSPIPPPMPRPPCLTPPCCCHSSVQYLFSELALKLSPTLECLRKSFFKCVLSNKEL